MSTAGPVGASAGRLVGIWLADEAAAPMRSVSSAHLLTGRGIAGDRYALGGGTWARYPDVEKQLTLIDEGDVEAAARATGHPLTAAQTRRNLVTRGTALPELIGRRFAVGDAVLVGVKRCPPCRHLERLVGVPLLEPLRDRGGINAAVLVGGTITPGLPLRPLDDDQPLAVDQPG
jgi:MOSC domain-containing protein YiiM